LERQRIDVPSPGADDVLIRTRAAGICHSDAHYRAGLLSAAVPVTPGHEVAGIVEEVGEAVDGLAPGDRVCLHYMATCGASAWCRRGHEQFCESGVMFARLYSAPIGRDPAGPPPRSALSKRMMTMGRSRLRQQVRQVTWRGTSR
jgi:Zn-dependent alcohol dehydrogenase